LKCQLGQVFSSGGAISFETAQETLNTLGVLPTEVYGSTETGGIAYRQQTTKSVLWNVFPAVNIQIDPDSKLSVQYPYLESNVFYKTADIAVLKNSGQFILQGRGDRIVKVEGKRVCLIELEKKLTELPEIQEAHTVLLKSQTRQEIGAVISLTESGKKNLKELGKVKFTRTLRAPLQSYFDLIALPRRWRFVDKIPCNAQGKRPASLMKTLFENKAA
jgi:acyl-coenzyme A synthetase/AMP-(fatty) acid ligase